MYFQIKLYYKLIIDHPEWFTKDAPLNRKDLLEKDVRIALPAVTDKDGRPVYVAKLGMKIYNCNASIVKQCKIYIKFVSPVTELKSMHIKTITFAPYLSTVPELEII